MKTFIKSALACIFALAAVTVSAQPQQGPRQRLSVEERVKQQVEQLKKDLQLTETQEKQISEFQLKRAKEMAKQMEEMRESGQRPDRDQMRKTMEKRQKEESEQMKKILSEEQFKKWETKQKEQRENMRNRMQGQGGPRGERPQPRE